MMKDDERTCYAIGECCVLDDRCANGLYRSINFLRKSYHPKVS